MPFRLARALFWAAPLLETIGSLAGVRDVKGQIMARLQGPGRSPIQSAKQKAEP